MNKDRALQIANEVRGFSDYAQVRRNASGDGWTVSDMWYLVIVYDNGETSDLT